MSAAPVHTRVVYLVLSAFYHCEVGLVSKDAQSAGPWDVPLSCTTVVMHMIKCTVTEVAA